MNENINLIKILKGCRRMTKMWSSIFGDVFFDGIDEKNNCINIIVPPGSVHQVYMDENHLCNKDTLFPSRTEKDWVSYNVPTKRFDPYSFKPFDKILVLADDSPYNPNSCVWRCDIFSYAKKNTDPLFAPVLEIATTSGKWCCAIPYNDETKHLVGTADNCPDYYAWWKEDPRTL